MRGATLLARVVVVWPRFQSTLLMRGATWHWQRHRQWSVFQSTLLMRGATSTSCDGGPCGRISIHAPHARSDSPKSASGARRENFNPRSSCEERRRAFSLSAESLVFQSTLLMRGATQAFQTSLQCMTLCQSTLLMRGATLLDEMLARRPAAHFNPRSSCEERHAGPGTGRAPQGFQSTLLMRGATFAAIHPLLPFGISIHAPHARSDASALDASTATADFNPRSSCEERLESLFFSSVAILISIHAPHARSDLFVDKADVGLLDFNPRSSCEERREQPFLARPQEISIHAPHARSDEELTPGEFRLLDFNPRSSCEERLSVTPIFSPPINFNPRSSCEERRSPLQPIRRPAYFNPRSSCEERRRGDIWLGEIRRFQSTLLMRGATWSKDARHGYPHFNPRSSCEERRTPH